MLSNDFLTDFHHVATIGATPLNGVDRQAATAEDALTRDWFATWIHDAGYTLHVDGIGNMFGLIDWTPGAAYVLVGSHLDSQPLGGRFDGAYGVLAALHAARNVDRRVTESGQVPKLNLAVVNWFNEEGGRVAPSVMGSSVFAGLFDEQRMLDATDLAGTTVRAALAQIGYLGTDPRPATVNYAEIHIEQGRILEREEIAIGVVARSWYTQKLDIEVLGEQSHTGATAMADRHDALHSRRQDPADGERRDHRLRGGSSGFVRGTADPRTQLPDRRRPPGAPDCRPAIRGSGDPGIVQTARTTLLAKIAALAKEHDIQINVTDFDIRPIRFFPEAGLQLAEAAASGLGLSSRRIQAMAGHDSVAMNTIVPSIMLFIPSVDGVSHCEREFSTDADMVAGLGLLTEVAKQLVSGALVTTAPTPVYAEV